jgi:multiple sugar transport system substrate-binding protein
VRRTPAALPLVTFLYLVAAFVLAGCPAQKSGDEAGTGSPGPAATNANNAGAGGDKKITIAWAEWEPAKQLEKLTQDFTKETGIAVEVQQIPWSNFETEIKKHGARKGDTYDLIVGDSQWLGKGATAGHYVDLTDWAKTNIPIADIAPAALKSYGEYPAGSGKLYAVPCMSDATGFAYRKGLVQRPQRKGRVPGQIRPRARAARKRGTTSDR